MSYVQIKAEIAHIGKNFCESISKEISFSTQNWLNLHIKSLEILSQIVTNLTPAQAQSYFAKFTQQSGFFDHYQLLFSNGVIIFDGNKTTLNENHFNLVKKRDWYAKTMRQNATKICVFESHEILHVPVINICTPFGAKNVLCGITKSSDFFSKIREQIHDFVQNAYLFDESGEIIASLKTPKNGDLLRQNFLKFIHSNSQNSYFYDDKSYTEVSKIANQAWYIGVSIDEKILTDNTLGILLKNALWLLCLFVFLIISSILLSSFIYRRILGRQKDFERILSHELKTQESANLIFAITHQLKQPINSSMLLLSNTLNLMKLGAINNDEIMSNLSLCIKSNQIMNNTAENFNNFYKYTDTISRFDLYTAISNLSKILEVEYNQHNIALSIQNVEISVQNNENFLQQILLVLLQNSKDALKDKKSGKKVEILAKQNGEFIEISVIDNGVGVKKVANLFSKYGISKKPYGSGIGLYISKIIAKNKLGGYLKLQNAKNPTIFLLVIKQNMEIK